MRRSVIVLSAALWVATIARAATPNDLVWVQPESTRATPGASILLEAQAGAEFRGAFLTLAPARVESTRVTVAGQPAVVTPWVPSGNQLRAVATFARPGIAVVEIRLKPEARSISRAEVDRYLIALHASDDVQAAWEKIEPPNPWQEVRTVAVKAYVRVGTPVANDRAWLAAAPTGLEICPVSDPTTAQAGESFAVRVTRAGQPVAGVVVEYVSDGELREHVSLTDQAGTATAPLDQAGAWLVRCIDVQRVTAGNHDWETAIAGLYVVTLR